MHLLRLLVVIFFLTQVVVADAQLVTQRDSLRKALARVTVKDTSYVQTLNSLSQVYRSLFPDSAFSYATRAHHLADSLTYPKGISRALNYMGVAQFFKGNVPEAQKIQMTALQYSENHHLPELTANALNSLALTLQYQGNYFSAMDYYLKSLKIEEDRGNKIGMVKVMANMGTLYKRMEEYDEAIRISERALELSASLTNAKTAQANLYVTLGIVYEQKKNYKKAVDFMKKSLQINQETGNKIGEAKSYLNLGYFSLNLNQLTDAEDYLHKAIALARDANTYETNALSLMDLAEVRIKQKRFADALKFASESYEIFKQHNFKDQLIPVSQTLAQVYEGLGNHEKAFQYLFAGTLLADSLKNEEATRKINDLRSSYELHKKEVEVTQLEKESEFKRGSFAKRANTEVEPAPTPVWLSCLLR